MTPIDAIAYLTASKADLETHRQNVGDEKTTNVELRHSMQGLSQLHCQLWWTNVPSPVGNEFMWDALTVEVTSLEVANQFVEDVRGSLSVDISSTPAILAGWRAGTDVPLFSIHPQRYRVLHPLGRPMAQAGRDREGCAFSMPVARVAGEAFKAAQRSDMRKSCLRWSVMPRGNFSDAIMLATFYADFAGAGRNIFSFPAGLTAMFARTDVTDIPLDALQLPFRSLYLSFGAQDDLDVEPGWVADGAYVSMVGDRSALQFALTATPKDPSWYARWLDHPEPVYVQSIDAGRMTIGVGEAVDLVFADQLSTLREQMEFRPPEPLPRGVVDVTATDAVAQLPRIERRYKVWKSAVRLVVNALAYLSAYPSDIDRKWPDGTPQSLYLKTQEGSFKQKRNATSKLAELGYSEIHYCGRSLQYPSHTHDRNVAAADSKVATWVRGHWRRQPYGPQSSLRKLIWLMPVLRNAAMATAEAENGHIYNVASS